MCTTIPTETFGSFCMCATIRSTAFEPFFRCATIHINILALLAM